MITVSAFIIHPLVLFVILYTLSYILINISCLHLTQGVHFIFCILLYQSTFLLFTNNDMLTMSLTSYDTLPLFGEKQSCHLIGCVSFDVDNIPISHIKVTNSWYLKFYQSKLALAPTMEIWSFFLFWELNVSILMCFAECDDLCGFGQEELGICRF